MNAPRRLDPACELSVHEAPATARTALEELGDGLQGPASRAVRRALDPLRRRITRLGARRALTQAEALCAWLEATPAWDALATGARRAGRRRLRADVLFPDPRALVPRVLRVRRQAEALDYPVPPGAWDSLHDVVTALSLGASLPTAAHAGLVEALDAAGWLDGGPPPAPAEAHAPGLWFLGHNSVLFATAHTRVVVDPWLRPWHPADPPDYRPLRACDLGRVDAVCITHSHGDHFHLGSLLALPREVPIFVPAVERESLLATELARRLRELGCTDVRPLPWGRSARVGDVTVEAMPFYGEQATASELVYPDVTNHGNTWALRAPRLSAAFLADTGRDGRGSMIDAAVAARRRGGAVDVVFGGMRGFRMYPLLLPFTTLDAMFVNVPPELLAVEQSLMNDADALLSTAEAFGASAVVPYADGGAPWYWRERMGPSYVGYPSYPGEREAPAGAVEDAASAPFPERLVERAQARYGEGPPLVTPVVLRPGDLVRWSRTRGPSVGAVEGFAWPY